MELPAERALLLPERETLPAEEEREAAAEEARAEERDEAVRLAVCTRLAEARKAEREARPATAEERPEVRTEEERWLRDEAPACRRRGTL